MLQSKVAKITIAIVVALLIAFLIIISAPSSTRLSPLPQHPNIQVYFNHNQAQGADYTDPYREIERPGDDLETIIVAAIDSAKVSVDVAVQELRLPKIAKALVEKKQAGIPVRVILENTYNRPWSSITPRELIQLTERDKGKYREFFAFTDLNKDGQLSTEEINQRDALIILKNAGIPVLDDTADGSKGSGLMHHKFVVVDGQRVITGSMNMTPSGTHGDFLNSETLGNANNLLEIESQDLARLFTEEFNLMWGDGVGRETDSKFGLQKPHRLPQLVQVGDTVVKIQFSPISPTQPWENSSNGLIGETLKSATESIDLALFVFSEQRITNILEEEKQQGVEIRALIDSSFAFRYYSEGLDMLGVALGNKCTYQPDNRPWKTPIKTVGTPRLIQGDVLHHKFGLIDNRTVITGSHNWSATANYNNDETVLVIDNTTVARHYQREFERLYEISALGIPVSVQQKIEREKKQCGVITSKSTQVSPGIVNVNTATQAQLETLPGIGPKLAQDIIKMRVSQRFTSLEDLQRVSGIGPVSIQKLEGKVSW